MKDFPLAFARHLTEKSQGDAGQVDPLLTAEDLQDQQEEWFLLSWRWNWGPAWQTRLEPNRMLRMLPAHPSALAARYKTKPSPKRKEMGLLFGKNKGKAN